MNRLLPKSANRRLNLISILLESKNNLNMKQLAKQLKCTVRTLKEDIIFINTNYKEYLTIHYLNNNVYMTIEPAFSYEAILRQQINNNLAFTLLEEIFLHEHQNIEQLSEALYASPSTLYRQARNINLILENQYNIKLITKPCCLVGEESDIRNFYTQLFFDKYTLFEWPFNRLLNEESLEKFIRSFIKHLPLMIDFAYFRNLKIIISIHIIRFKKGYRLKKLSKSRDVFINDVLEENDYFQDFGKQIKIDINLPFLREIYSDFIVEGVVFSKNELIFKAQDNQLLNKSYFGLLIMINQLAHQFNLEISNKEIMITNLNNTIFLFKKELYSNFLIHDRKVYFLKAIELATPQFYDSLKKSMKNFLLDLFNNEDPQLLNTMMYNVLIHWENLMPQLLASKKEIKVLIVSHSDLLHSKMIKDILVYKLPDYINFEVKKDMYISMMELVHSDYDIIISTFPLGNIGNKRNLCIESIPTQKDLDALRKMIDDLLLLEDFNL